MNAAAPGWSDTGRFGLALGFVVSLALHAGAAWWLSFTPLAGAKALSVEPAPPDPEEEDPLRLGLALPENASIAWLGVMSDPLEAQAPESEVDQAALSPSPGEETAPEPAPPPDPAMPAEESPVPPPEPETPEPEPESRPEPEREPEPAPLLPFPLPTEPAPPLSDRTLVTGNPLRSGFAAAPAVPDPDGRRRILVLGGSQGARVFSTVLPEALALLPAELRQRLAMVQQARPEDLDRVRSRYAELGIQAEIASFFDDMPKRLAVCDLVIARSGASTVAEVTACGRPALYVPYAHAADDHQYANAMRIAEAGGAVTLRELAASPETLADAIASLADDPARLEEMSKAARSAARPDATRALADLVLSVAEPRP